MKGYTIVAIVIGVVGLLGLIFTVAGSRGGVRQYIADNYRFVGTEPVPGDDDVSRVYASTRSVSATADDIADARKPADRRTTEAGHFLRYRDDIVAVLPPAAGQSGSRITVDDEDTGYRHHFVYLGGWWGRYSGPGESFRGGGPGGGK